MAPFVSVTAVADCGMTGPPGQATSTGIGGIGVPGALLIFSVHERNEASLQRYRPRTTIWPGITGVVGVDISRISHRNPFHRSNLNPRLRQNLVRASSKYTVLQYTRGD